MTPSFNAGKPIDTSVSIAGVVVILCLFVVLAPVQVYGDMKAILATGEHLMGDNDTVDDSKMIARMEATWLALEKAGSFLAALTEIKQLNVTRDEMIAYSAAIWDVVEASVTVVPQGGSTRVTVTVRVLVDTNGIRRQIEDMNVSVRADLVRLKGERDKLRQEIQGKSLELSALAGSASGSNLSLERRKSLRSAEASRLVSLVWGDLKNSQIGLSTQIPADKRAHATALLEKALALEPDLPSAYKALGWILVVEGDMDAALRAYRTVLRLGARSLDIHNGLNADSCG